MVICGSCALLLLSEVGGCQIAFMTYCDNLPMAVTLPTCQTHCVPTWCAGIGAACTDAHVGVVCKGGLLGLVLGWAGGMLHWMHTMHCGCFGHATLS